MAVLHSGTSDDGDPILSWRGCSGSGPFGITSALLTSFSGEHDYVESTPSPSRTMFSITGDSKEVDCGELFRRNPRGFDCDLRRRKFVSGGSSRLLRYTSVQRGGISRLTWTEELLVRIFWMPTTVGRYDNQASDRTNAEKRVSTTFR